MDITDEQTLIKVAAAIGKWDILVLASGYVSSPSPVAGSATDDWWQSFEVNQTTLDEDSSLSLSLSLYKLLARERQRDREVRVNERARALTPT